MSDCPYEAEAEYELSKLLAGDAEASGELRISFSPTLGRFAVSFDDGREWSLGFMSSDDGVKLLGSILRAVRRDERRAERNRDSAGVSLSDTP